MDDSELYAQGRFNDHEREVAKARAEAFAAGRFAGIEEAIGRLRKRLSHETFDRDAGPMIRDGKSRLHAHAVQVLEEEIDWLTRCYQPAPAAASEPRSEAAGCTCAHGPIIDPDCR